MDSLYFLFEEVFNFFQSLKVSQFTGGYLLFQIMFFLLLITIHQIISLKELSAMNKVKKGLFLMQEENVAGSELNVRINAIFQQISPKTNYARQWKKYHDRINEKNPGEKIRIEPFFGLETMHSLIGRRHILDFGGGIHVSLGVLGTFLGLSMGLSGLNSLEPDVLREGIAGLIEGMKVAFYTSVLGVVLSIIWIFLDRLVSRSMEVEIDWHTNELGLLLNADDEEIFLDRLEKITKQQSDQLKTILTDALEHVMQPFVQTVQSGNEIIQTSFGKMHEQIKEQSDTSKEHLELMRSQNQEVSEKVIGSIKSETEASIGQFVEMMNVSRETQSDMLNSVQNVVQKLEVASENQERLFGRTENIVESFTALSSGMESTQKSYDQSFNDLTRLSTTLKEMQELNVNQIPVQQAILEQNSEFMNNSSQLVKGLAQFGSDLKQMQSTILEELVNKTNAVSSRFEELSKQLMNSAQQQYLATKETSDLIEIANDSIVSIEPIVNNMGNAASSLHQLSGNLQNMQSIQNELTPHLSKWNDEVLVYLKNFVQLSEKSMEETTRQILFSKEQWESTAKDFEATREELGNSMKEFSRNIESGVTTTFQLFDKELVSIVNNFKSMSETYTESQEDMTEAMQKFTDILNGFKVGVN